MKVNKSTFSTNESGRTIRIHGNPTLLEIQWMELGVYAKEAYISPNGKIRYFSREPGDEQILSDWRKIFLDHSGEIWVDELRLSDVEKNASVAFQSNAALKFADLGNVNINYEKRDADFHIVSNRLGNNKNVEDIRVNTTVNLNKFLPSQWGLIIPLNVNYTHNNSAPKYLPGQDVKIQGAAPDSIRELMESKTGSISFRKNTHSDFWLTKWTVDKLFYKFSGMLRNNSNVQFANKKEEKYTNEVKYNFSTRQGSYITPFSFLRRFPIVGGLLKEWKWYYTLTALDVKLDFEEKKNQNFPRFAEIDMPINQFSAAGELKTGYRLWDGVEFAYKQKRNHNLDMLQDDKWRMLKYQEVGLPTDVTENTELNFQPKFARWFSPKLSLSSGYSAKDPKANQSAGGTIGNISKLSSSLNVNLKQMMDAMFKKKSSNRTRGSSRGGRNSNRTQSESDKKNEKKSLGENFIIQGISKLAGKFNQVQLSYSKSRKVGHGGVILKDSTGAIFQPDWQYRFGLSDSHGLAVDTLVIVSDGDFRIEQDYSLRSGFKLSKNISADFHYAMFESKNISQTQNSREIKQDFLPLGDDGLSGFPFIGWSVRWLGWEKMPILEKITKSISLEHTFAGSQGDNYLNGELRKSVLEQSFSPLVGAIITFPFDMKINTRYTMTRSWDNSQGGTTKSDARNMTFSMTYKRKSGIKLPWFTKELPFIKMTRFPNNIDFSLTFDNSSRESFTRNSATEDFTIKSRDKNWKVVPQATYSFTNKVSGTAFFEY